MTDRVCVGAIAGAFGVKGEVRLKSFCAEAEAIADYGPLTTEDGSRAFTVNVGQPIANGLSVRLSGVMTKEQADALKGTTLWAARDAMPSLPDDEFYYADLIGMDVFDTGGVELGQVKAVLNHGATDLLEVHQKGASKTMLLPFTKAAVPTVDLASGRIIADPPEGLLE